MCYYNGCNYVIRLEKHKDMPTPEDISEAIEEDSERVHHKILDDTIPAV
jgi:hypothetical protein